MGLRVHVALTAFLLLPVAAFCAPPDKPDKTIAEDADQDGRPEKVAHLDARGRLMLLEVDTDRDGRLETRQYYENEALVRIEKDRDGHGGTDTVDILENGVRKRREEYDKAGRVVTRITFDAGGEPEKWERDTDGDGRLDTVQLFLGGRLQEAAKDTNADGRPDVWQVFEQGRAVSQKRDADFDGRVDTEVLFDSDGNTETVRRDTDGNGSFDTVRTYEAGKPVSETRDIDDNGRPERRLRFKDELPALEERDGNGDGRFDIILTYENGLPGSRAEDTDFDGVPDRVTDFDAKGRPALVREQPDGAGGFFRTSRFDNGRLSEVRAWSGDGLSVTRYAPDGSAMRATDANNDGRFEQTARFAANGDVVSSEADTDADSRADTFQKYENGRLSLQEQDRDGDGKPEAVTEYADGKRRRTLLDNDRDGRYETIQDFSDPEWEMVTRIDGNGDERPEAVYCHKDGVVRRFSLFDPDTGILVREEAYADTGRMEWLRETSPGASFADIFWRFGPDETPVSAEKDTDGDGKPDTWFAYENGRVASVAEDRDRDGRPDLWETYDESETVILRKEDVDYDGTADIETADP